jgi:flagellar hook assembly protein FlgD
MELKAWDIFNNSSELSLDFKVVIQKKILIDRFTNYPNPLKDRTTFMIDLEGPNETGVVDLEILSLDGKQVRRITETINQVGLRSLEIEWNGLDKQGRKPQPGIYVGRLTIKTKMGIISSKVQKLIIL